MTTLRQKMTEQAYVGPATSRVIAAVLLAVGALTAVGGVGYALNGATQAPANVRVEVSVHPEEEAAPGEPVTVQVPGVDLPEATWLQADGGTVLLVDSTGASRWTGFLARGDYALGGLAVGLCALLLAPVLTSLADGDPFRRRNAARIGVTAATIMVVGTVGPLLPQIAAMRVLDDLGLADAGSPLGAPLSVGLTPLGVGALVFAVAEAFRRGAQITEDTRGLV